MNLKLLYGIAANMVNVVAGLLVYRFVKFSVRLAFAGIPLGPNAASVPRR